MKVRVPCAYTVNKIWQVKDPTCSQDLLDIVQDLVTRNVTSHEKAYERVVTDRDNVEI